jgi:hypothetical protein
MWHDNRSVEAHAPTHVGSHSSEPFGSAGLRDASPSVSVSLALPTRSASRSLLLVPLSRSSATIASPPAATPTPAESWSPLRPSPPLVTPTPSGSIRSLLPASPEAFDFENCLVRIVSMMKEVWACVNRFFTLDEKLAPIKGELETRLTKVFDPRTGAGSFTWSMFF